MLDAEPDLASGIPPEDRGTARYYTRVPVASFERGRWDNESLGGADLLAVIVLDGLLLREVIVGDRVRAELLGPGDVLRPWEQEAFEALTVAYQHRWTVLEPLVLGLLDERFARLNARWPEVTRTLMQRMAQRSQRLALQLAIGELQGIDVRLRAILWYLAERWGRVTSDGVIVPFPLTHQTLGTLIGARRPSVSTALSSLAATGDVQRLPSGSWLLAHENA